ncbi:pantothenate kinase [Malassezia equina]|uniref:Pantothenate kinase n=1 Tax=Malassezia equina TaxID=1381935 RepID=A0AAF0EDR8_9BASI|nr:pantothenate kinase [Malassezia equina]
MLGPPPALPVDVFMRTHGARIIVDDAPSTEARRDGHDIYLPNHTESVSHIAVDVGGSLAKVVYFTRTSSCAKASEESSVEAGSSEHSSSVPVLFHPTSLRRRSLPEAFPGGRLNFVKFESSNIQACVQFLHELIEKSAAANQVTVDEMQKSVKIMATGGGAHLFYERFTGELGVEVQREDEMACLITGLNFMTLIPDEVFWFSDRLIDEMMHTNKHSHMSFSRGDSSFIETDPQELPRPSASPPLYEPMFESTPSPKLPCLLVNIGSGVSILKIDEHGQFERVSGTSLGGGTLWGLLGLLTDARNFDEMLELCERGDNSHVDMLVGDIYGPIGLDHLGLSASTIASSFGKVFRWDRRGDVPDTQGDHASAASEARRARFRQEDICRSLLYAISNNIGQIAHMNAEKYKLDRVYFGGSFIRGHRATIATLSYAIRFWSKGRRRAYFLRHEGYLGAVGAWVRHIAMRPDESVSSEASLSDSMASVAPPVPPMLADALGGAPLDAPRPAPPRDGADVAELLDQLADLDTQDLPQDAASIGKLMAQLDQAHQVADMIESRVDQLLEKLGAILPDLESPTDSPV